MSGGHFNYRENQIGDTASEIEKLIAINVCEILDRYGERIGNSYPPEIIEKFEEAAHTLRQAAEMVMRIDYLVSGDDGQDTFLRLWQTEVRKSWDAPEPCSARDLAEKFDVEPLSEENHSKNVAAARLRYQP